MCPVKPEKLLILWLIKMSLGWVYMSASGLVLQVRARHCLYLLPHLLQGLVSVSTSFLLSSGFSNPGVPLRQMESIP